MKHLHVWLAVLTAVACATFNARVSGADLLRINEFMAWNTYGLDDDSGDEEDWIEIQNYGTTAVNLDGWFLTDKTNNLTKWRFPATNLTAGAYLIVFASERDRRTPGRELHTNFKLSNDGEYLALVKPDGMTVASHFHPTYPIQAADVSYGWGRSVTELTLVPLGAPAKAFVPANANAEPPVGSPPEIPRPWTTESFDDTAWQAGTTGVGYDTGTTYLGLLGLIVTGMQNVNQTVYIRIPFNVTDPSLLETLTMEMEYDDGFIAYINGHQVAADNAPASPTWNSAAPNNRSDSTAVVPATFNLTASLGYLKVGVNVLAIQGLNNGVGSSDLLMRPKIVATTRDTGLSELRYFPEPTPGVGNNLGLAVLGPIITDATHSPHEPNRPDPITVTARLRPAFGPVTQARLRYRVMYGSEVEVPFLDDGLNGDGGAADGVYGAVLPGNIGTNGQMVRWFLTAVDHLGNASRSPAYVDTANSPQYYGAVIAHPALTNPLPVLHWFIQTPSAADTDAGSRCSFYYLGEFYDNCYVNIHGQSSRGFPKKSYDIDFNPGHNLRWKPGEMKADDINLLTTYPDKAHMRNYLAYETYHDAGDPYHFVVPVRIQRNSVFWGDAHIVENGDDNFLERNGLDPRGALYKMYSTFTSTSHATDGASAEKKTRKEEDHSDLLAMYNGVVAQTGTARTRYMMDNLDIPQMINYLAARIITSDKDCCHKNYYFYRDTEGNGEWQAFAWDVDLSFGRNWYSATTYWDQTLHSDNGLYVGNNNGVFTPLLAAGTPFQQMYLRRIRTLMDDLIQPPGTPAAEGKLEKRIDEMHALIKPDAELDAVQWPYSDTWGNGSGTSTAYRQSITEAVNELKNSWLPARRTHMYTRLTEIPAAQPADANVMIADLDYNPASHNQAQEYVAVSNVNTIALDISGWQLTGGISHTFKPGTVIPGRSNLYVAQDVKAFRARTTGPRGGIGLFIQGNFRGQLSARGETLSVVDRYGRVVHTHTYAGLPSLAQQYLRITEIMYHPAPLAGNTNAAQAFEYIQLKNTSTSITLDLAGVRLTNGIDFNFTTGAVTTLPPGATVLVVANPAAFAARYGSGFSIAGQYIGLLDNSGERIRLLDAVNEEVLDFEYNNSWYPLTEGLGFSLVVVDELAEPDLWNAKSQWRQSGYENAAPGAASSSLPLAAAVHVNEALTHTDPPQIDAIELHNPAATNLDVGGWFLSDDLASPKKFRIPDGTVIPAGGFLVCVETDFNPAPGEATSFALSADGDEAYLFSADAGGNLTGYYHGCEFGAAANGVSFGRHVTSDGLEHFVAQAGLTFSNANAGPLVGPVVISEIMYHPTDYLVGGVVTNNPLDEYIELYNDSAVAVPLYDESHPANRWRLRDAVDFEFPAGTVLPPSNHVLIVSFNPTNTPVLDAFRTRNGIAPAVPVYGPWSGQLDNAGDSVDLERPDTPGLDGSVPYILVERVAYTDQVPWPAAADGLGPAMHRVDVAAFGNEPANWVAAVPTPGEVFAGGDIPVITIQPADLTIREQETATFTVGVAGTGPFTYLWRSNSYAIPGATNATYVIPNAQFADSASYSVLIQSSAGAVISSNAVLTVRRLPVILAQPASVIATNGQPVAFAVAASGTGTLLYQWKHYGHDIPGETGPTLSIASAQFDVNDGYYSVVVSDEVGSVESAAVLLTIKSRPTITEQLTMLPSTNLLEGRSFTLTISAVGNFPMGFRFRSPTDSYFAVPVYYTNHVTATLTVHNAKPNLHQGLWDTGITNSGGSSLSRRLAVTVSPAPPFFAIDPTNQAAASGATVQFVSEARGTDPIAYQWYFNGTNALPDATNAVLTLSNAQTSVSGDYHAVATNSLGAATSAVAQLTLQAGPASPQITRQPDSQSATVCAPAMLSVTATGEALTYQWWFNATTPLAGETSSTLTLPAPRPAHEGGYSVVVTNAGGAVTSQVATLTVVLGDQDGDGMPDAWELQHGFDPCSAADRDLDADSDGRTNWEEAVSGTDPNSTSSVLRVDLVNAGAGGARIQFEAVANVGYTILYRTNLTTGDWLKLEDILPQATPHDVDMADPNAGSGSGRFYRIVTPIQQP
ncbi:MAG: lamin tail domain-containing protein [Verrucomicrobia bacterium]|nr:lamin tail domain-containing protein [Verrucomicrobiota bacterium]